VTTSGPPGDGSGGGRGGESLQAVVRALGSLLTALGSAGEAPRPEAAAASSTDPGTDARTDGEEPERIFEEARRRAYATIDEAVERARASTQLPGLATVHARLDRLERRVDAIDSRLGGGAATAAPPTASPVVAGAPPAPVGARNGDGRLYSWGSVSHMVSVMFRGSKRF